MTTSASPPSQRRMKRVLGVPSLVLFALAYMVPLGVFTTYGVGTELTKGHLPLAYIVIMTALLFTAYSYGRMAKLIPFAGSAYSYARGAFGERVGFVSGWTILADYMLLPLVNYLVIGLYLGELLPGVPVWVWIAGAIVSTTVLNVIGIKLVTSVNLALCTAQALFILVFIVLSTRLLSGEDVPSLMAPFYSETLPFDGLLDGAAILCFTFLGFDAISALSEDSKNPRRTVPRAILISVVIAGIVATTAVYFSQLAYPDWTNFTNVDTAATDVFRTVGGDVFNTIFIAAYVAGCVGSAMSSQASGARILFAMGRDGVLSKRFFGTLHPRFRTPVPAIIILGAISSVALVVDLTTVVSVLSFGALFAYVMVNLAVIKTYLIDTRTKDRMSVLKYGIVPGVGAAIVFWLWTSLSATAFIVGAAWAAIGIGYLLYMTRLFTRSVPKIDLSEFDEAPHETPPAQPSGQR
ncbi:MAG: amino acid permease [Pseudonocardiaceae bacterium]|nr:amino acid permease [Pseudonocardiaceae bacterium]